MSRPGANGMSRPGAAWTRRQRWKNDAIFACASLAIRLGLALPRGWLPRIGTHVGHLAYALLRDARTTALENLARVHPAADTKLQRAWAREVFGALGRNLTDTLTLLDPTEIPGRTLTLPAESSSVLRQALAHQRGVVYVTGHLGPWERMAALLAAEGFPISTMARESYDRRFHALVYERLRNNRNIETIYRGSPGAAFAMVRALRRGRVLGFLVDLPGRIPTLPADLLGLPSRLPLGPARIALRAGCPLVVGTPSPGASGLEVSIRLLPSHDLRPGDEGERELVRRMADALSARIRELPAQWPWMHPFVERANEKS